MRSAAIHLGRPLRIWIRTRQRLLCGVLGALLLAGCASSRRAPESSDSSRAPLLSDSGVRIEAYVTMDGTRHPFEGRAQLSGDSYRFLPKDVREPAFLLEGLRMRSGRRGMAPLAVLLVSIALVGCASTQSARIPGAGHAPHPIDPILSERGISVTGYTTTDGVRHRFMGRARLRPDGSFEFTPHSRPDEVEAPPEGTAPLTLPREQVAILDLGTDPRIGLALALGVAAAVAGTFWLLRGFAHSF